MRKRFGTFASLLISVGLGLNVWTHYSIYCLQNHAYIGLRKSATSKKELVQRARGMKSTIGHLLNAPFNGNVGKRKLNVLKGEPIDMIFDFSMKSGLEKVTLFRNGKQIRDVFPDKSMGKVSMSSYNLFIREKQAGEYIYRAVGHGNGDERDIEAKLVVEDRDYEGINLKDYTPWFCFQYEHGDDCKKTKD